MNEEELKQCVCQIYGQYLVNEEIEGLLPIRNISFENDVVQAVLTLQPELADNTSLDKRELSNCSGYTCLFPDNTATIVISTENIGKNMLWMETLIHEITHVKDYKEYLHIVGAENFQNMLKIAPFWYWTEFHAKYKGCTYMLAYAKKLPPQDFQPYIDEMEKRIREFPSIINKRDDPNFKIYNTMHLMGEMLAFENQSIVLSRGICDEIYEMYDWFVDTKNFLSKHMDSFGMDRFLSVIRFLSLSHHGNGFQLFFDSIKS